MISPFKKYLKLLFFKIKYYNKNVIINSELVSFKSNIGNSVIIQENTVVSSNSIIGDFSYINKDSSLENTIIGKFCSIASGVIIGPFDHDYSKITTHPFWREPFYKFINNKYPKNNHTNDLTQIGNDVWIGTNVIIKSGLKICDGSIIGAGSVVTKNIPPYEIWAGVPAKKIKNRFDNNIKLKLLELNWTSKNINWIKDNIVKNIDNDIEDLLNILNEKK